MYLHRSYLWLEEDGSKGSLPSGSIFSIAISSNPPASLRNTIYTTASSRISWSETVDISRYSFRCGQTYKRHSLFNFSMTQKQRANNITEKERLFYTHSTYRCA